VQERAGTCALQRVWISSEGQDHTGPPPWKLRETDGDGEGWIRRGDTEKDREREFRRDCRGRMGESDERGERGERDCTPSSWQPMVVWLAAALVRGERAHTKYRARPMREK